jgi:hypothetical protein
MTTIRLTGNTTSINSTASVIPIFTLYGGNSTVGPGATSLTFTMATPLPEALQT